MKRGLLIVAHSVEEYGADRCLYAVIPGLVEQYDVTVAVPSAGAGIEIMRDLGARVVELPDYAIRRRHLSPKGFLPWMRRVTASVRALGALHREQPFSVVYSNTLAAGIGPIMARRWRLPHVVHVHECPANPAWLPRLLLAPLAKSTDRVIANSHFTAAWVEQRRAALRTRIVVVYNGLDVSAAPPTRSGSTNSIQLSCVARIHPKKGHATLFDALRRARDAGRDWQLHLYGDTLPEYQPLHAELEAYAREHDIADRIHWQGFVGDIRAQYADADIAVVPSVQPEEFSLVCLEAQSQMVPVVATGPGGISEVIDDQHTGLLVPPGDPAALFAALCRLADDPELRQTMGRAGRSRVEAHFSRRAFVDGVCAVIASMHDPTPLVSNR